MENKYSNIDCVKRRVPINELSDVCLVTKSVTLSNISLEERYQFDGLSLLNFKADLKLNCGSEPSKKLINASIQLSGLDLHGICTFSLSLNYSDHKSYADFWQSLLSPNGVYKNTHWIDLLVISCESNSDYHGESKAST